MTAHASQGQTFGDGAVVDLRIGGRSSAMSSYVALTRVKTREDSVILRPFPRTPFNQGQKPGLQVLLQQWRGEFIDWKAIEAEHTPKKMCRPCANVKYKKELSMSEWSKQSKASRAVANNA